VDARFRNVISAAQSAAQSNDISSLHASEDEIRALAQEIRKLYASMDNSLRFPAETAAIAAVTPVPVPLERDYRGVACPMNFVKVKLNLSKMQKGERLRVLLDDGPPVENVPRSVAQEGHKVLEQTKVGDHWAVLIEKS
jgi:sulfite reductase (ferredoxin)